MTSTEFADAARQSPVRILRLPMLPYSLGHEIILLNERNALAVLPFAEFNALPLIERIRAVVRAAQVCCRTWKENQSLLPWLWLWSLLNRNADIESAIITFQKYRLAGSTFPLPPEKESDEIANGKEDGRQLGSELLTRLANFTSRKYSAFGFESAFDFPFGLGLHLYFTELEMEGRMRIENAKERQIREEMAGHYAAIKKERAEARAKEAQ